MGRVAGWGAGSSILALVVLAFTAFEPLLPDPTLDGSWRYAVAAAAARGLAFGRDFVFTFGPLGMLYSGFRLPSQDALYLVLHILLSVGLFTGFLLPARRAARPALVLLPAAVAVSFIPDAVFFLLPFTLVVACDRRTRSRAWAAAAALLAACDGLLPLVKGTMSVPVIGCTAVAAGLLARERSPWAVVLPAITAGAALGGWAIAGQRVSDLPAYLWSQAEVAAGYTDAMSVFGPAAGPATFAALATAMVALWTAAALPGRRIAVGSACALVCFVAFKAGYVRDDGHCLISASALLLLGLLLFLHDASRRAALGLVLGIGGWAWIAQDHMEVGPRAVASRTVAAVSASARSVVQRIRHPGRTFAAFERRKAEIAADELVPRDRGRYDAYPIDQTPLLASGLPWAPRPVVQSYSAYTPALATLNADHLAGAGAPDRVLFDVTSLDDRYPNLDDGPSWPILLSRYDHLGFFAGASHLGRSAAPHDAAIEAPFLSRTVAFGEEVALPPGATDATWARLDFHPSLAGRLASLAFKAPRLLIDVSYRDGHTTTFRMVAGEGAAGFLLSPTVASARDFVALKLGAPDFLVDKAVGSFRLRQEADYPFWGTDVDVTLSRLAIAPDPGDTDDLRGTLAPGAPLASLPVGGECVIDIVADQGIDHGPVPIAFPAVPVDGWAMLSTAAKAENGGVRLALVDRDGVTFYASGRKVWRPDLDRYFGLSPDARVAYTAVADVRKLHGTFALYLVQDGPDGPVSCPTGASIAIP